MSAAFAGESLEAFPIQNPLMWQVWGDFCELRITPGCIDETRKSPRWKTAKRFLCHAWVTGELAQRSAATKNHCPMMGFAG